MNDALVYKRLLEVLSLEHPKGHHIITRDTPRIVEKWGILGNSPHGQVVMFAAEIKKQKRIHGKAAPEGALPFNPCSTRP